MRTLFLLLLSCTCAAGGQWAVIDGTGRVTNVIEADQRYINSGMAGHPSRFVEFTPTRRNYPGIGFTYDRANNRFIPPQPFRSWVLDANAVWQPPTPRTSEDAYWDEQSLSWKPHE